MRGILPRGTILVFVLVLLAVTGVGGLLIHALRHAYFALAVLIVLFLLVRGARWFAGRIGPT
ncbi:MAG: hypothetical protein M0Z47_05055 [Actinomycetota bacterium]|nr:hypothetical protein [Actinomycetota bacterium]